VEKEALVQNESPVSEEKTRCLCGVNGCGIAGLYIITNNLYKDCLVNLNKTTETQATQNCILIESSTFKRYLFKKLYYRYMGFVSQFSNSKLHCSIPLEHI
jgi:hypothetical protein